MFMMIVSFIHNNQEVPMDDFGKFQPHQTADDKEVIIFMPPRPRPAGGIERSGCPYVCTSVDQVNIFVQSRISRPINGSKLIFHMSTSRNIQEPKPYDLYFTVHWFRTLARLSRLRFLSKVES